MSCYDLLRSFYQPQQLLLATDFAALSRDNRLLCS